MNSRPCGVCSILNQPCNAGCFWAQSIIKVEEDEKEDGKFRVLLHGDQDASKVEGLRNLIVNGVDLAFVALFSQADIKTVLDLTKQHGKEWVERELSDVVNGLVQSAKEDDKTEDDKTEAEVLLISELFSEEDRIAILDLTKQHGKEWVERKLLDGLVQIAKEDEKAEAEVLLIVELFSEEGITAILDIVKQIGKEWVVSKLAYVVTDLVQKVQKANSSACAVAVGDSAAYHRTLVFGDDVVIVAAYQAPICEANCGSFKDTYAKDLLALVLKAVIEKTNVNPSEVGDIVVGTLLTPGSQRETECRMAAFYAGFPETVPIRIVDRQCSSELQAIADVAAAIRDGFYDIGIGASLESMTSSPLAGEGLVNPKVKIFEQAQNCLLPMGITSENVAHCFGVARQEQDQAAVESHQRATAATASDKFKDEIIPVPTKIVDPKTGDEKPVTISIGDGIRPNARFSDLAKPQPVSMDDGSTTAGNFSQVSDGAGAVLLMKRSIAVQKGLPILGVFRTFAVVSTIMGVGPATAIPAAVKASGLELDDIDLFVINEAFASQFVACPNKLELDLEKVNVNGGARVATLLHEMKHRGKDYRYGVISMCIGSGMGAAAVFERGDVVDDLCNAQVVKSNNLLSKDAQ